MECEVFTLVNVFHKQQSQYHKFFLNKDLSWVSHTHTHTQEGFYDANLPSNLFQLLIMWQLDCYQRTWQKLRCNQLLCQGLLFDPGQSSFRHKTKTEPHCLQKEKKKTSLPPSLLLLKMHKINNWNGSYFNFLLIIRRDMRTHMKLCYIASSRCDL